MSKKLSIQISLPTPCSQSWDEMTPEGHGRFCAHCQHTVIDFTTWSDNALYNFFSKGNEHVCGRFLDHQLNRPVNIPYQPNSRLYRIAIALGLTLMFTQAQSFAQSRPPATQGTLLNQRNTEDDKKDDTPPNTTGQLYGIIVDEKKEPMISAAVQLFKGPKLISGAVTDIDGNYLLKNIPQGDYSMIVHYAGYNSDTSDILIISGEKTLKNITMKPLKDRSQEIRIIHYGKARIMQNIDEPTKRTFTRDDLNRMR